MDAVGNEQPNISAKEKWPKSVQFLFGCIGLSAGLGNIWRFPYLCYKHGGGSFLISYTICVIFGAIPMFMLEVAMGQWTSQGAISCWNHFCPLLKGVGCSMVLMMLHVNTYYGVIMAWALRYLKASFTKELPWIACHHAWNTAFCFEQYKSSNLSLTLDELNYTPPLRDPASEYWEFEVLSISRGIDDVGELQWGTILYVTSIVPYIFMLVLMVRGLTLPGSMSGLKYYLSPDLERLKSITVWEDAASQAYISFSAGLGILTAFGSYNKFHYNFRRPCIIFAVTNFFTSFLSGFVIFIVLGIMSNEKNIPISELVGSGPGWAFVIYSKAITYLPAASAFSVLFFAMLLLTCFHSMFGIVEGVMAAITDVYPRQFRRAAINRITRLLLLVISALKGLTMCTNGGIYVFVLYDNYCVARTVIIVGFVQMSVISWLYGMNRFYRDVEVILGFRIGFLVKIFWAALTPLFNLILSVLVFINFSEVTYDRYQYPTRAIRLGWMLSISSLSLIPLYMVFALIRANGTLKQRFTKLLQPIPVMHEENMNSAMQTLTTTTQV